MILPLLRKCRGVKKEKEIKRERKKEKEKERKGGGVVVVTTNDTTITQNFIKTGQLVQHRQHEHPQA
jgi:pyruvate-formate lyase-activating enzyme